MIKILRVKTKQTTMHDEFKLKQYLLCHSHSLQSHFQTQGNNGIKIL